MYPNGLTPRVGIKFFRNALPTEIPQTILLLNGSTLQMDGKSLPGPPIGMTWLPGSGRFPKTFTIQQPSEGMVAIFRGLFIGSITCQILESMPSILIPSSMPSPCTNMMEVPFIILIGFLVLILREMPGSSKRNDLMILQPGSGPPQINFFFN